MARPHKRTRVGDLVVRGGDPDLVLCFRVVRSTCVAPRVTCWRRTGGVDVWISTMSRTMQTVAAPQPPGDVGGKWLLGWVTEKKGLHWQPWQDTLGRLSGLPEPLWSRGVPELLGFPYVSVHLILRYGTLVTFLYRYQSSAL